MKKSLSLLIVLCMMLCTVACNNTDTPTDESSALESAEPSDETSAESSDELSDVPSEDTSADESEIPSEDISSESLEDSSEDISVPVTSAEESEEESSEEESSVQPVLTHEEIWGTDNSEDVSDDWSPPDLWEYNTITTVRINSTTFENLLVDTTHILTAKFTGEYIVQGETVYGAFTPINQFRGSKITGDFYTSIMPYRAEVSDGSGFRFSQFSYKKGQKYIMLLTKFDSVNLKYDVYSHCSQVIIPMEGSPTMYGKNIDRYMETKLDTVTSDSVANYVINYVKKLPPADETYLDYIHSDSLTEITELSGTVITARIDILGYESRTAICDYACTVVEVLKGNSLQPGDSFKFLAAKDMVEVGETYLLIIRKKESAGVWTPTSKHSIHALTDTDAINEILLAIK